jgi:GNAT superfamily N-acetyltransferase
MSLVIDRLGSGDLPAALRLSTQAGWNQLEADWRRLLDLSPEGCLAGRLDGAVVATATIAAYGRDAHWIGMVLVDEAMRGRGFGSAMLSRVIDVARSRGGVVGLDATDLGRPVYLKQGFVDVAPIDRWTGVLRPKGHWGPVERIQRSHLDQIVELDRAACGIDRSALLRHLLNDLDVNGFLAPGSGYGLVRPGRTCSHIGPVVARDEEVFARLLNHLATVAHPSTVLLDALRTTSSSVILEDYGLTVARRLTRMTLGGPQRVLMGDHVRAAVSFEWG